MIRPTISILALAAMASDAVAARDDRTGTVRVQQIVYRDDVIAIAPFIEFARKTDAGGVMESNGRHTKIRTTIRPQPATGVGSFVVRTMVSIPEDGIWSDLDSAEFTGGIGSSATKTWRRTDGTTYRLVTSIGVGTTNAAIPPP